MKTARGPRFTCISRTLLILFLHQRMQPATISSAAAGKQLILSEIADNPEAVKAALAYPEIFTLEARIDPWPVVLDEYGVLRWKRDTMISQLFEVASGDDSPFATGAAARAQHDRRPLNLGLVKASFCNGRYSRLDYLRLHKRLGYSLQGYYECLSDTEDFGWYDEWVNHYAAMPVAEPKDEKKRKTRDDDTEGNVSNKRARVK